MRAGTAVSEPPCFSNPYISQLFSLLVWPINNNDKVAYEISGGKLGETSFL